jgi:hypothetical protein
VLLLGHSFVLHLARKPTSGRTTFQGAGHIVARFPAIRCWDISYDAHHRPWVGIAHIGNAARAIRAAGRKATVRVTYSDPMTAADVEVMQELQAIGETECVAQAMRPVGRGEAMTVPADHGWNPWIKPCLTQGMVVRYDGTVAPCCLNLVESRRHPFDFGDPRRIDLAEVHRNFATDPLLQLIRALGFGPIRDWAIEEGLAQLLPDPLPEEVCGLCTSIMHTPALAEMAMRRATSTDVPLKIAVLAAKVLRETEMLAALAGDAVATEMEANL